MFFRKSVQKQLDRLEDRIEQLEKVARGLLTDQEKLEERHMSLRGKVYAHRLHKPDSDEDTPRAESRDELRRRLTQSGLITPGKPTRHD